MNCLTNKTKKFFLYYCIIVNMIIIILNIFKSIETWTPRVLKLPCLGYFIRLVYHQKKKKI